MKILQLSIICNANPARHHFHSLPERLCATMSSIYQNLHAAGESGNGYCSG